MPARPRISAPVGKSGPGMICIRRQVDRRIVDQGDTGVDASDRLCGGMFVAMPTAMPPAPLTRRFGKARRQNDGSESEPS
jgi:hypothetical protein